MGEVGAGTSEGRHRIFVHVQAVALACDDAVEAATLGMKVQDAQLRPAMKQPAKRFLKEVVLV